MPRHVKTFVSLAIAHCMVDCYGGIWPMFKYKAGIDLQWAGFIATLSLMIGAAIQPIFGVYADHGHRRMLIIFGAVLGAMSMLLAPAAGLRESLGEGGMYAVLLAIMLTIRVGQSMFHPAGTSLAGNLNKRRSMFIAMFIATGMSGFAMSHAFFSLTYTALAGATQWMLLPAAGVILLLVLWCHPEDEPTREKVNFGKVFQGLSSVSSGLFLLLAIQSLMSAMILGVIFLLPEFLELRGYPRALIEGGGMLCWVAGAVVLMIPAGMLADRIGRRNMLLMLLVGSAAAYYAMVLSPTLPVAAFVLLILTAGGLVNTVNPICVSLGQHLSPRHASVISGVLMGLSWAIGAVSPAIVGWLAQQPSVGVLRTLQLVGLLLAPIAVLAVMLPPDVAEDEAEANAPNP